MGTGYTRNDTANNIADGNVINASDLDGEFDAVQAAFDGSTGHSHDGTTGEGPQIDTAGLADDAVTGAKIDSTTTITAAGFSGPLTGTASNAALLDSLDSTQFLRSDAADTKTSGDLSFADNVKAQFGASNDLQLYHDGLNSYIKEAGSGGLIVQASTNVAIQGTNTSNLATFFEGGAVTLYHNNAAKLTTTATGVDVTGQIDVNSAARIDSSGIVKAANGTAAAPTHAFLNDPDNGMFRVTTNTIGFSTAGTERLRISSGGDISFFDTTGTNPSFVYDASGALVVNEDSRDFDFRVESNGNTHALFVDASANSVAMGTSTPGSYVNTGGLAVKGATFSDLALISSSIASGNNSHQIRYYNDTGTIYEIARTRVNVGAGQVNRGEYQFSVNNGAGLRRWLDVDYSGNVVFNADAHDSNFQVSSDSNNHALFVDAGNSTVGINTSASNSTRPLHISKPDSTANYIQITNSTTGTGTTDGLILGIASDEDAYLWHYENNRVILGQNNLERLRVGTSSFVVNDTSNDYDFRVESNGSTHAFFVDAGGEDVCIGKNTVDLTTNGFGFANINTVTTYMALTNTSSSTTAPVMYCNRQSGDGQNIAFRRANLDVGNISVTSSGTTYNTTSDRRLKTDIQPIADATDKLMQMQPVTHKWKADPDADAVHGFIAQDMQQICPEAVSGEDGGEEMMSMDYGRITPVLVAALQEAANEIRTLKERVAELEAK